MIRPLSPNRLLVYLLSVWVVLVVVFVIPLVDHRSGNPVSGAIFLTGVFVILSFWLFWRLIRRRI
jgi:hypothetical protein